MNEKLYLLEPFAAGYLTAKHGDSEYRIANGIYFTAKYRPLEIKKDTYFVGNYDHRNYCASYFQFGDGMRVDENIAKSRIRANPELKKELSELYSEMRKVDTKKLVDAAQSEAEKAMFKVNAGWGGGQHGWCVGHSNPNYILPEGTAGVRQKIEKYRKLNSGKDVFYDSLTLCLDALDVLAERYLEIAREQIKTADEFDKKRLERLVNALENVPANAPRDFYEACVSFWLVFSLDGYDSPGRFDQYMINFYRMSDETDRRFVLEELWKQFHEYRSWNLCVGGSDENGNDESNELSCAILETAAKYKFNTPNLTLRVHKNTPDIIWCLAKEALATGIGMPAIYNDECVCPALEALGIPKSDSHGYCMNGCNQIDIFAKSNMGLEDGEVCLAKCLELTLFNGVCPITGAAVGIKTGEIFELKTFDELVFAYKKQVEYIADLSVSIANKTQKIVSKTCQNPHRSNLFVGCIENGEDFKCGGTLYYNAQILAEGIANTVDSLAAIKHFVFDTEKYTLSEVRDALSVDFDGFEELLSDFSNYKKFGTDDPETNAIYKDVVEHFYGYLLTKKAYRGGSFGGGCSPFNRVAMYGGSIGALPNGKRRASAILADSIGAVPGCDKNGPTALLNSVLSVDHTLAKSGHILQLQFTKELFRSEEGMRAFEDIARVYFEQKGQQLTVNVLSRDDLLEAQIHPEKFASLIVRVGGYSDYFVNLSRELQENIIQRTEI